MPSTIRAYNANDLPDEEWKAFHALRAGQEPYVSGFFDPDFARLIAKVRNDVSISFTEDQDGLLAYWPMHIGMGRWARAIGVPFSDRNGPVVRAGANLDISKYLQDHSIAGFRTSGMVLCDQIDVNPTNIAHTNITNLKDGWDAFLTEQTQAYPRFFKKMRRLGRKLEKEHSDIVFTFDDKCSETFHKLISMKQEQFSRTHLHDVLRPKWVKQMLDMLRHGECENTKTVLSTLRVDGKLAAAEFNIQSGNLLHGWLVAFDPEFSKYSPGLLLTQHIIKSMPEHGLTLYDSGPEHAHYKKYFTNQLSPLAQGPIFAEKKVINPIGILGDTWSYMEEKAPYCVSNNLARVRRRADQIIGTEIVFKHRVLGFSKAALPFL